MSEDSYLGDLLQPLTRNRYLYVCNNPLNFIDPTGHINWSRQLKYLTATVLGLAVGAAALAAFPATIAVGVGAAAVTFLMANAVMNKAEAMVQISSNSRKLAENRKTLENTTAKLNYIQSRFGTNEERMPSDVRAEVCKLKSTMKNISEQNRMLCDSNAYYQKQDAAGNAQLQMALGTISLVLAPYAGPALAGGGTMAGMTGAALGANAGIGLAIGGFDYNEAYTGKNPVKDFLGANTYEDVRTISNLVSGETVIAGASGVQAIEDARRADEIGNISQNTKVPSYTVWDDIYGTADKMSATEIPATFKIDLDERINYRNPLTGTNTLWTNSNASEHMWEYVSRFGEESESIGIRSQAMMESYSYSLNNAMETISKMAPGKYFGVYGNWELGINTETGVVYHARMIF